MATGRKSYYKKKSSIKQVKRKINENKSTHHATKKVNSLLEASSIKRTIGEIDFTFLFLVFVLFCFGMVMLLSASTPAANTKVGNSYYFFTRQLLGAGIGFVGMIFLSFVDYHSYKKYIPLLFWGGVLLLILCRIEPIGVYKKGGWRWLNTPFIQMQPSELMKPLIALYFAKLISDQKYRPSRLEELVPYIVVMGVVGCIMLFLQSHASGAIIICGIGVIIILVAGAKFKWFFTAGLAAIPVIYFYLTTDDMRMGRILSLIDPFRDTTGKSYQIVQSLIAIGSGGFFGRGLGQSMQKYAYLPEPYNDFIFAVVCEELGFVGAVIIITLFVALIIRGIKIALEAPDIYGMLTVIGIISHIAIQTVFNIGVVCCAIPNTGISLPFFSFGGTAIVVLIAEIGIVLNISSQGVKTKSIPKT